MPDETLPANEAQDTVAADEAQDTLVADDAQDTLAAQEAQDTLTGETADDAVGDDSKSPFEQFDTPGDGGQPPATRAAAPAADEIDSELEKVETALEADPADPEAMKRFVSLSRKARQRDAAEKRQLAATVSRSANEAAFNRFTRESGLAEAPKEVRDKLPRKEIDKRLKTHYDALIAEGYDHSYANGAALTELKHEIKTIIASAGKQRPKPNRVNRTESGATLTPPGGAGGRTPKTAPKPENVFVEGDWVYPSPILQAD